MDMSDIFKKAQELQAKMQNAQSELSAVQVEGVSGGGMVKIVVNGRQEIISVEIEPEVIKVEEKELLEEMIAAAMTDAIAKSKEEASKHLQENAGNLFGGALNGLNIPGL